MSTNGKKSIVIGSIVLIALIITFAVIYALNKPSATTDTKDIIIEVTGNSGKTLDYRLSTDAEYLIQAMDELSGNGSGFSYSGPESDLGIMVEFINGEEASFEKYNAYWVLYVNGEYGQYTADKQPVEDEASYIWIYEKIK